MRYLSDDLSGPMPADQADSLALVDASCRLCYTSGLLSQVYGGQLTTAELTALMSGPGAYQDLDGDGNMWAPSGTTFYSPDPAAPDASFAAANFYLPQGVVDPFGKVTSIGYDPHNLMPVLLTDPAGNVTTAQVNYRVAATWLMTDPNLNRSGVRYDPLGLITATALMGKLLPDASDEGDHLDLTTDEASASDDPTTTLDYDLGAYQAWASDPARDLDHPAPIWTHTRARVRHKDPATPWLESYTYSGGSGRVVLKKIQAEPGMAPVRDSSGTLVRDAHGAAGIRVDADPLARQRPGGHRQQGQPGQVLRAVLRQQPGYDDETDLVTWGVTAITSYDPLSRADQGGQPGRQLPDGRVHLVAGDQLRRERHRRDSAWYAARDSGPARARTRPTRRLRPRGRGTPAVADLDILGRVFQTIADNGAAGRFPTTRTLDIEGQVTAVQRRARTTADDPGRRAWPARSSIARHRRWRELAARPRPTASRCKPGTAGRSRRCGLRRRCAGRTTITVTVTDGAAAETLARAAQLRRGRAGRRRRSTCVARSTSTATRPGSPPRGQRDFQGNVLTRRAGSSLTDSAGDADWSARPRWRPRPSPPPRPTTRSSGR